MKGNEIEQAPDLTPQPAPELPLALAGASFALTPTRLVGLIANGPARAHEAYFVGATRTIISLGKPILASFVPPVHTQGCELLSRLYPVHTNDRKRSST
jgi:hypothetical protein